MLNRTNVTIIIVFVLLAASAFLVYTPLIAPTPKEVREIVVCIQCRHVFEVRVPASRGGAPYVCPLCDKRRAFLAFQCQNPDCQAIFAVTPEQMKDETTFPCPVCGEQSSVLFSVPEDADALARLGLSEPETDR